MNRDELDKVRQRIADTRVEYAVESASYSRWDGRRFDVDALVRTARATIGREVGQLIAQKAKLSVGRGGVVDPNDPNQVHVKMAAYLISEADMAIIAKILRNVRDATGFGTAGDAIASVPFAESGFTDDAVKAELERELQQIRDRQERASVATPGRRKFRDMNLTGDNNSDE